jgi:PAS domain S-box-containing protein
MEDAFQSGEKAGKTAPFIPHSALYDAFYHDATIGIFIYDASGRIVEANPFGCEMSGYSIHEIIGLPVADFIQEDDRSQYSLDVEELNQGKSVHTERVYVCRNGERFFARVRAQKISDGYFMAFVRDVTELKKTESNLLYMQQLYQQIVETASEGVWGADIDRNTIFVNRKMADMLGYHIEDMLRKKFEDFLLPEEMEDHNSRIAERHTGKDDFYQRRFLAKDGRIIWGQVSASALRNEAGKIIGSFGMITDITEYKAAEQALTDRERYLASILNSAPVGITTIGFDQKFIRCNNQFRAMFGYEASELENLTIKDLTAPDDLAESMRQVNELIRGNIASINMEKKYIRKDGTQFWARVTATAVRDEQGQPLYLTAVLQDIDARKMIELELRESRQRLLDAERISKTGNYEIDIRTGISIWSEETKRLFGLSAEDDTPTVEAYSGYIHKDDVAGLFQHFGECIEQKKEFDLVYRIITRYGKTLTVHSLGKLILDKTGEPVKMFGTFQDITEIVEFQTALQESEKRFRALAESIPIGIYLIDLDEQCIYANAYWCHLAGLSYEEDIVRRVGRSSAPRRPGRVCG